MLPHSGQKANEPGLPFKYIGLFVMVAYIMVKLPAMMRQTVALAPVSHDPAAHSHALIRGIWTFSFVESQLFLCARLDVRLETGSYFVSLLLSCSLLCCFSLSLLRLSCRRLLRIPQVTCSPPLYSLYPHVNQRLFIMRAHTTCHMHRHARAQLWEVSASLCFILELL